MKTPSYRKHIRDKITALIAALCLIMALAPAVLADSDVSPSSYEGQSSVGKGFESVEQDGGLLFVGTAKIPKSDSDDYATVKYIYSSGLVLNKKSIEFILSELNDCGITISKSTLVSDSNISESSLITEGTHAVFACGSADKPTELVPHNPYQSAEESFEALYKGYIFSISGYASLKNIFAENGSVTLSEDGKTAYTVFAMDESYVERVINGRRVTVLMINSELKYSLRAPKLTYAKDENYTESPSDMASSEPTSSDASTTTSAVSTSTVSSEESSTSSTQSVTTSASSSTTTAASSSKTTTSFTAGASANITSAVSNSTTVSTSASTVSSTSSTTAKSESMSSTATTKKTTTVGKTSTTLKSTTSSTTTSTIATVSNSYHSNPILNRTTIKSVSSQRAIVNTRRLPLNIRSGPGMNYMIVTVLPKGTYVMVLDTENPDWYMVKTMGKVVGYAYSKYIRIM